MKEVKGYEWTGLLTGKAFTPEELEEMAKRAGPNACEEFKRLVAEDKFVEVDLNTIKIRH